MKRALALVTLWIAVSISARAEASPSDHWFGGDKALHFGLSAALAAGGYAASSIWLEPRAERAICGGALSLTLGGGKELWDLAGHGDPSWRDFTWDVIGSSVGVALALAGDALLNSKSNSARRATAQGLGFRF